MLAFLSSNILDILLILVGLSAVGVYFWQKYDQLRTAATLLKGEIDTIEKRISVLKDDNQIGNISIYHSQKIMGENLWNKYKYLLVKSLSKSEAEMIGRFFDSAEQIERARIDICNSLNNAWTHASFVEHNIIGEFAKNITDYQELQNKIAAFRQIYTPLDIVYTPQIAINAIMKHLGNFSMLVGTTGYKKIEKISYEK